MQEMQGTWVQSLGGEDALEEGMTTHSSILAWRIPMNRRAWRATVHSPQGHKTSGMTEQLSTDGLQEPSFLIYEFLKWSEW